MNRKEKRLKSLFLFCIGLLLLLKTTIVLGGPDADVRLEPKGTVRVGQNSQLTVRVSWKSSEADYHFQEPVLSVEGFSLEGLAEGNEVFQKGREEWREKAFRFTLRASKPGKGIVHPFRINYYDALTQSSAFLDVSAIEQRIAPGRSMLYCSIGVMGLLSLLGFFTLKRAARYNRDKKIKSAPSELTLEEKHISLLLECEKTINSQDLTKNGLYESGRILRIYLAQKYNLPTNGVGTSHEIISKIQGKVTAEELRTLRKIFDRLDEFRYADRERLIDESRMLFREIIRFLEGKKVISV